MKKNTKRSVITFALLAVVMLFASCAAPGASASPQTDASGANKAATSGLPIANGNIELTLYCPFDEGARQVYTSLAEHPVVKMIMEQTGLKFKFIHPPANDDGSFFNTTIASGQLPDIFMQDYTQSFGKYPGGPAGAIQDGILIDMQDLIEQYAPNFLAVLESSPPIAKKMVKDDSGSYVRFGGIFNAEVLMDTINRGPIIRKDLLDKLGLGIPETIDEYEQALTAFKENNLVDVVFALPKVNDNMVINNPHFATAYGVRHRDFFYDETGKVQFSPIQSEYKDYLTLYNRWYENGLIDKEFATRAADDQQKAFNSGKAGMMIAHQNQIVSAHTLARVENPEFEATAAYAPKLKKGDVLRMATRIDPISNRGYFVTSSCKHPVEAVRFIDHLYSPEVVRLVAWGPGNNEYPTFTTATDGSRSFTEFMTKNPDCDFNVARTRFAGPFAFVGVYDNEEETTKYNNPYTHFAWDVWCANNTSEGTISTAITPTMDESAENASIMNPIYTYVDEMYLKFVMGIEPLEKFDAFVSEIKKMNIDKAIANQQAAFDRYTAR